MDVVDLTDSAFGDAQEAAAAGADSAKDGETPSAAAELRARTELLTSRINQIDVQVAQLSAERAQLETERNSVRAQLVRVSSRGPRRDWSGGVAEFPEWGATVEHALTRHCTIEHIRPPRTRSLPGPIASPQRSHLDVHPPFGSKASMLRKLVVSPM